MRGRTIRLTVGIVGTAVLAASETLALAAGVPAHAVVLDLAIGLTYLYGGLAIWGHEPENRTGRLMTLVGVAWFLPVLARFEHPLTDVGLALYDTPTVLIFALTLAYPSGRLETRVERVAVAILAIAATGLNVIQLVTIPLVVNEGNNGLVAGLSLAVMTSATILRRWLIAPARSRRELLPVLIAGGVFVASLTTNLIRRIFEVSDVTGAVLEAVNALAPAAIPVALLIGFYRRSERRMHALVGAIPDRIVRIARDGRAMDIRMPRPDGPAPESAPWATEAVAPSIDELLAGFTSETAMAAAARALDEGGLQAFDFAVEATLGRREYEARLTPSGPDEVTAIIRDFTDQRAADAEVRRSRVRIVEATDAERRRLERDLHDGAQQRLAGLSLSLRLLRARLGEADIPDPDAIKTADDAAAELKLAIGELRELARGIHPAILTTSGLGAAITALAERSAIPAVVVALPERRLSPGVEATAYFVVSEALANTAKHASARHAAVGASCDGSLLRVEVSDDGVGGADRSGGTGLEGLNDRVAAVGGRLLVDSPPGQGTRIVAEIPLDG
jgi:signal transduction histidine kinase